MNLNSLERDKIQADAARHLPQSESPRVLFTCEHASNAVPSAWGKLDVDQKDLDDHIGWDIGAACVTEGLSALMRQPAILAGYSRLFFDINRIPGGPEAIPGASHGTLVPGNQNLSQDEQDLRRQLVFDPYFDLLESLIKRYQTIETVISVHSYTPELAGVRRPWDVGVLWQHSEVAAQLLIDELNETTAWCVGNNQPYNPAEIEGSLQHAVAPHENISLLWIEVRNDLISCAQDAHEFSTKMHHALTPCFLR